MSRIHASASLGLAALALAFVPSPAQTQTCGFPIAAVSGSQNFPTVISDGSGGAYVAWVDTRSGESRVYLVRLDTSGQVSPGWPVAGLQVSDAGTEEVAP